jgi:hypothetical protein
MDFPIDSPQRHYALDAQGEPIDQEQDRCAGSREQAEAVHVRMIERVQASH